MWAITLINEQNNKSLDEKMTKVCEMFWYKIAHNAIIKLLLILIWLNLVLIE